MTIRRRDFLKFTGAAALAGGLPRLARAAPTIPSVYDLERFGNARILHMTDTHAQLQPVYFREPSVNLGIGAMQGKPPHLVGRAFLDRFGIRPDSADAYAFTCLDFEKVRRSASASSAALRISRRWSIACAATSAPGARCCSTAAISGRAPDRPMPCRAPTWSRPPTCSASKP